MLPSRGEWADGVEAEDRNEVLRGTDDMDRGARPSQEFLVSTVGLGGIGWVVGEKKTDAQTHQQLTMVLISIPIVCLCQNAGLTRRNKLEKALY